jgi:hypothetical protein
LKEENFYLKYIINKRHSNSQLALWRAVILQAFVDLLTNSEKLEDQIAKRFARSWILGMSQDFKLVCSMAGYNPYYVRRKAVSFMNNNKVHKLINNLYTA